MVHIGNDGFTFSNKARNNQCGTCTNVGSAHGRTGKFCFTTHHCMMAVCANVGT
jgi:hypothetical protein